MSKINAVCVYCGSSPGTDPAFVEAARDFGKILAHAGIRLVWGGGSVGLMGAIAAEKADRVIVTDGLRKDDIVVTAGVNRLRENQKVRLAAEGSL